MRIAFIGLAAALAGCTAPPPVADNAPIAEIAGRVAGPAQRCILLNQSEGLHAANRSTLAVGSGKTVWVNHLMDGCSGFGRWDVLVTEPIGTAILPWRPSPLVRFGQQDPGAEHAAWAISSRYTRG